MDPAKTGATPSPPKIAGQETASPTISRSGWLKWVVVGAAGVAGIAVLFWFDPAQGGFYPVCMFHRTTGLLCPGCGGLRALHQMLHGHFAAAFQLNPLIFIGLPAAVVLGMRWLDSRVRNQKTARPIRTAWLWAGLLLLVAFGIGRNL